MHSSFYLLFTDITSLQIRTYDGIICYFWAITLIISCVSCFRFPAVIKAETVSDLKTGTADRLDEILTAISAWHSAGDTKNFLFLAFSTKEELQVRCEVFELVGPGWAFTLRSSSGCFQWYRHFFFPLKKRNRTLFLDAWRVGCLTHKPTHVISFRT